MNNKAKICMNAMVGSEEATITRMLESVAPYISYWVVQCNGKDRTKEIIENFFKEKNIPGFTYEIEWNFPGWNRDHTLQTCLGADHGCDWILRMDADERLQVDEDFDWSIFNNTSIPSLNVTASASDTKYFRTWCWNAKLPWFFAHDRRHETIHLPDVGENFERINLPWGFRHLVSQDGNTWFAPRKFLKDALELELDKIGNNTVLEDTYHMWYLAKSYADCYGNPNELPFGKKHSDEYARRSIWYYERFLEHVGAFDSEMKATREEEMVYFALILMGHAYAFIGDSEKAIQHYKLSHQFSPRRNESHLYLTQYLENLGRYDECIEEIDYMLRPERTNVFPGLSFLIEDRAYHDTSNFLYDYKNRLQKKIEEPTTYSESFVFNFE